MKENIWWDETINPIIGCSKISDGCQNCYALRMAHRHAHNPILKGKYSGIVHHPFKEEKNVDWTGELRFVESELRKPDHWREPRRIFVGSMTDLFHENVQEKWFHDILIMTGRNPRHTFIFLTKRPENILPLLEATGLHFFKNTWLGVTAENQEQADKRIPILLQIPAEKRFVSVEPMLCRINAAQYLWGEDSRDYGEDKNGLDWVICGAETGPGARPMKPEWAHDLKTQCITAGVPFFFKQWSRGMEEGRMPREIPE